MRDFNLYYIFFFFNDTATTEIYTLSLHDALPISNRIADHKPIPIHPSHHSAEAELESHPGSHGNPERQQTLALLDRKSTRLNSSHANISYAVFCLKKKKKIITT